MIKIITNILLRFYYSKHTRHPNERTSEILNVINNHRLIENKTLLDYYAVITQIELIEKTSINK